MLYLEIQRGKAEMPKWSELHQELGATASCSVRATMAMANAGQKESLHRRNLVLGDSWFASVKTAEAIREAGHEWIGVVKTSHSLFPKQFLESTLKTWPGGMNLALETTTAKGVRLIAVGYKYNSSKVLCFVATKNAGSTTAGEPYRARFLDDHDNLISRPVDRPELISTYFQRSNGIDKHNQARQFELRLEKHWRTHNAWFRLVTTMIGVIVTDAWKGYKHAFQGHQIDEELTLTDFADRMSYELIHNNFATGGENSVTILSPLESCRRSPRLLQQRIKDYDDVVERNLVVEISDATVSPLTNGLSKSTISKKVREDAIWMQLLELHKHVQQDSKEATGRKIRRHCSVCKSKTGWYCVPCKMYCCPELKNSKTPRNCYKEHILEAHPSFKLN
jgi:hypothetical protein